MGLTRKLKFGISPPLRVASPYTTRDVPLTQGVNLGTTWPLLPPGSTTSMINFLPLDGALIPRSRLSSLNTIRSLGAGMISMAELDSATFSTSPDLWCSATTLHGVVNSLGSISVASFVSAFGLGVAGIQSVTEWQYTPAFSGNLDENMLVAAGSVAGPSYTSLLVLYHAGGAFNGAPLYSYLTGAPKAKAVGSFDNYLVAFNTVEAGSQSRIRVRWTQRGNPSAWTGEGSGFEDLLGMSGFGTAVRGMADGRLLLFSNREIWYANTATYPAQFVFNSLDKHVGCPFPRTIIETDEGLLFLGSDLQLRLLPTGGGKSTVVSGPVAAVLRRQRLTETIETSWGVYDPYTKLYYLFVARDQATNSTGLVVNTVTGEWAFNDMKAQLPLHGIAHGLDARFSQTWLGEGLLFTSGATVYSTNSLLATDSGSVVTSTWRSAPIASDLPGNHKQIVKVCLDYRATSKSTVTLKISQDGGNNYEATGVVMSLGTAPVSGRVEQDVYQGGAFPCIEFTSTSTGYELHRVDTTLLPGGRR